eukprot:1147386-Pelagomonas_calceolata.AAC.8
MNEQGNEQPPHQQRPPPPPRFQLCFLKREPEDPKVAWACALEGGSVRKMRIARRVEEGNASSDEDSNESEEGGGSSEKDGGESEGVCGSSEEESKGTWSTNLRWNLLDWAIH